MAFKAIGIIRWKYENTWHSGDVTEIVATCDTDTFIRYHTDIMFDFMNPLLKVSQGLSKPRCYFLTERSANGDINFPEYETKGYLCELILF